MILGHSLIVVDHGAKNWKAKYRFVNKLLGLGFSVSWVLYPINVRTLNDTSEKVGSCPGDSFVIEIPTGVDGTNFVSHLNELASNHEILLVEVVLPPKIKVMRLSRPSVGLFANGGSPFPFVPILSEAGIDHLPLSVDDILRGRLREVNVLAIPGGGDYGPPFQGKILGKEGRKKVREFVRKGGAIWGSCAGCCNLLMPPSNSTISEISTDHEEWREVESLRAYTCSVLVVRSFWCRQAARREYWRGLSHNVRVASNIRDGVASRSTSI